MPDDVSGPVPVGPQRQLGGAGPAQRRPTSSRWPAAASANRSRVRRSPVATSRHRPVSGSVRVIRPTSGNSNSRGSTTSTASTWWRALSRRNGRSQAGGASAPSWSGRPSRKSETTTARPRRGADRCRLCSASASEGAVPPAAPRGAASNARSRLNRWVRPPRAGNRRMPFPPSRCAPSRLPTPAVRNPTAATAATASSRFSSSAVPKSMLGEASTSNQVTNSRSASTSRTCGVVVRAVTAQSIRRTSSAPGRYSRLPANSLPGPGSSPRCWPCSRPLSLRVTVSSNRRNRCSGASRAKVGSPPAAPRPSTRVMRAPDRPAGRPRNAFWQPGRSRACPRRASRPARARWACPRPVRPAGQGVRHVRHGAGFPWATAANLRPGPAGADPAIGSAPSKG